MGADRSVAAGTLRAREWMMRAAAPSLDNPRFESLLLRLHASIDIREFWSALLSMLEEFVPHDACVAYLDYVDFAKTWHASRILATPNARRSREWLQRRREASMMPAFALSNPGIKLYRLSEVVPDALRLRESEFFRRFMAAEGWHYSASSLFWDADRLASEIVIRRTPEQGDFTAREMALLERVHPHLQTPCDACPPCSAARTGRRRFSPDETWKQACYSTPFVVARRVYGRRARAGALRAHRFQQQGDRRTPG